MAATSSGAEIKDDEEIEAQDLESISLSSEVPLRVLSQKKLTVKGLAVDVQDKANSLHALERIVQNMQHDMNGLATKKELDDLHVTVKRHLQRHAEEVQTTIEASNVKLLAAIMESASSVSRKDLTNQESIYRAPALADTGKQCRSAEIASADKRSAVTEDFQRGKSVQCEEEDWTGVEMTPLEQSVIAQVKDLLLRGRMDREVLLPALGSILELRQLEEYKTRFTAAGAACVMSLLRAHDVHVCSRKGQSLKSSVFNFLSSSTEPCRCNENDESGKSVEFRRVTATESPERVDEATCNRLSYNIQRKTSARAQAGRWRNHDEPSQSSSSSDTSGDERDSWMAQSTEVGRHETEGFFKIRDKCIHAIRSEYPKEKRFNGSLELSWRHHCREFLAFANICGIPPGYHKRLIGLTLTGQALVEWDQAWRELGRSRTWKSLFLAMDVRFESPQRQEFAYEQLRSITLGAMRKESETVAEGLERMRTIGEALLLSAYGEVRDVELRRFLWDGCRDEPWIRRIHATDRVSADSFILSAARASAYRPKAVLRGGRAVFSAQALSGRSYTQGNPFDPATGNRRKCRVCEEETHYWAKCPNVNRDIACKERYKRLRERLKSVNVIIPEQESSNSDDDLDEMVEEAMVGHVSMYTLAEKADLHAWGIVNVSDIHEVAGSIQSGTDENAILDTGAATSIIGRLAFRSLCRQAGRPALTPSKMRLRLGNELHESFGSFRLGIAMPREVLEAQVQVLRTVDAPLLLGNDALLQWRAVIRAGEPAELEVNGETMQLLQKGSHLMIPGEKISVLTHFIHFNQEELKKIHCRMGHPHPDRLLSLLRKAAPEKMRSDTRKDLQAIYDACQACAKTKPKPLVFKASVPDEIIFGHELMIDMCSIGGKVVLHVIDRGTGFQAAEFAVSQRASDLWEQFLRMWATRYMSPDVITSDAGSAFISQLWNESAANFGIILRSVPVESHSSMGRGEHHGRLRRVFEKLRHDHPRLTDDMLLSLAVKAINECPNVLGFTPTTLVFGIQPKLPVEGAPTCFINQKERLKALKNAQEQYSMLIARERLEVAQNMRGPVTDELDEGDLVHVFREGTKRWDTIGRIVSIDAGNVIHVQTGDRSVTPFSRSNVRKFREHTINVARTENVLDGPEFDDAKKQELDGLEKRGVYRWVQVTGADRDAVVLPCRFVCTIKNSAVEGQDSIYKARLVAGGHRDPEKGRLVTEAPTVKATSVMVIIAVAMMRGWRLFSRDVKQAFTQSGPLKRKVYLKPHHDVLRLTGKNEGWLLLLLIPLYGLTEAPSYWWLSFADYHIRHLRCKRTILDPCVFYQPCQGQNSGCAGCIGTLVDDTIGAGNEAFIGEEEKVSGKHLDVKQRNFDLFDFAGCRVEQHAGKTTLSHDAYIQDLKPLEKTASFKDLQVARGKLAWIASARPDVAVSVNKLAQVTEKSISAKSIMLHNKVVQELQADRLVRVVKHIEPEHAVILVFTDASFASNQDLTSQLGHVVILWSRTTHTAVVLEAKTTKSRRVTRSVLGAELCGVSHGFDRASMVQHQMHELLGIEIPLVLLTDSLQIFHAVTRLSALSEKRLQIDAAVIREAYESKKLTTIAHVAGDDNIADCLTKQADSSSLKDVLRNGMLHVRISKAVEEEARSVGLL